MTGHMIERSQPWVNGSNEPMTLYNSDNFLFGYLMHASLLVNLMVKWVVEFLFWVGYMLSPIEWLIGCGNYSDHHGVHQRNPYGGPEGSNKLTIHVRSGCGAPPLQRDPPPSQRLWYSNSEPANGRKLFSGNHQYHLISSAFFFMKLLQ